MKRLELTAFGKTYESLADALEEAIKQLRLKSQSDSQTWDDRSHVSFDVSDSSDQEFCEYTNEEPETEGETE